MRISEWQTLFPSPTYASRTPESVPKRSRSVIASASACRGWVSSVRPLITGIEACSANSSTSSCSNVRIMSAERKRERTSAVSRYDSPRASWSSPAGRKSAIPPSSAIPTSKATRVRVEGLWKMRPIVRPGRTPKLAASRALGLELVREVEQRLELVATPGSDAREASAFQVLGDSGHG